ncbi:hypothetical protein EKO23_10640 [Nocardioides guangzhouensis]|uniref:Uncharacterized protein n=1 Tax=Nocardioides guangzhouensis TaxID=2497878 RepID=A0A4V1XZA5_9ACTN|nr:hypothetical protein [Nocardioides guangzhouensis]RYP86069.1 hypothetical protein EKO23_10640 [Nocardioides guangzhouensis]
MTSRRTPAVVAAALAASFLLSATGCEESADDRRAGYCDAVKQQSEHVRKTVDEGGAGAFLDVLPTLQDLADQAPSDLKDEWRTLINALDGLRDALDDTGLEPGDLQEGGGLPAGLSAEDRRTVRGAASVLASPEVVAATQGIEQQALDVCKQPLL